jgi:dTDP-4-dehydrorhamnose 3,5-epimerase
MTLPLPPAADRLPSGVLLGPGPLGQARERGEAELYREDWRLPIEPIQWNLVSTRANTLRGVHVHPRHFDYLCVLAGELLLALHDMRPHAPTYRLSVQLLLSPDTRPTAVIPPGVAHGFYFRSETRYCYAVDHYWNPAEELGCRWDDPELGFAWPSADPLLSVRDASAPSYADLARALAAATQLNGSH